MIQSVYAEETSVSGSLTVDGSIDNFSAEKIATYDQEKLMNL